MCIYDDLCEHLGQDFADIIIRDRGGSTLRVPQQPREWVITWLGLVRAQTLCAQFGGEEISVPRGIKRLRAARNERILAESHRPRDELARKYDLTDRQIRRIINSTPAKPKRGTRKGRTQ
jgi:hypothetical protein